MAKTSISFRYQLLIRVAGAGVALLAIVVASWATIPSTSSAQGTGACYDPGSGRAINYKYAYGLMVSRTDTASARKRTALALPTLSPSQVQLVSDTTVCRKASAAFDSVVNVSYPTRPVIVLALGSTRRVVIKDLNFKGPRINLLFDQNFVTLVSRLGL